MTDDSVASDHPNGQAPSYPDPIPGILEFGSLNLLAGASGVGKTCFTSWLLTRLRDAATVFGFPTNQPTALGYVAADRGSATAMHWLEKVGYQDLPFYSLADDPQFNTQRLRSKVNLLTVLGESIDKLQLPPGGLVVVDPVALFMQKLGDYHDVAVDCLNIRRILKQRQLTMIGLCHAGKQKADKKERYLRLQDRIIGSGALLGYGDTQMYLASPEETGDKHYTFVWRSHKHIETSYPLGRSKTGLFVPWAESQEAANEHAVFDALPADGAVVPLATILGLCSDVSQSTVFRRLRELVNDGLIEKVAEGRYRRAKVN